MIVCMCCDFPTSHALSVSVLVREGALNFARQRGDEFPEPVHVFLFNDILLACRNASQLPPQYSSLMTEPAPAAKPFIYLVRNNPPPFAFYTDHTYSRVSWESVLRTSMETTHTRLRSYHRAQPKIHT